ncbi:hypothetical protein [Coleofasciculus sp. FACHB-129]|nr:hypothetical protein [Coleofasciculus sp. FACHB-129]
MRTVVFSYAEMPGAVALLQHIHDAKMRQDEGYDVYLANLEEVVN